jgi:hypothetical protein
MLDGLCLNRLEEYKVNRLLVERTLHLNGPVHDITIVDYTEAILCGVLCELITKAELKWRKAFTYRFNIKEI